MVKEFFGVGDSAIRPDVYYDNFYAAHKGINRHIACHTVYFKLKSLSTEAHKYDPERVRAIR